MKRIILSLPVMVLLVAAGLIVNQIVTTYRQDKHDEQIQDKAVAKKVDTFPSSIELNETDRSIAESAFNTPEQIDKAPVYHYGKPQVLENLYASPFSSTSSVKSVEYQPRQLAAGPQPAEDRDAVRADDSRRDVDGMDMAITDKNIDPESIAYKERVNALMGMRQRRLQGVE